VASGRVAAIGGIVALLAVAFVIADQLPAGIGGGWVAGKGRRWRTGRVMPEPDYIQSAGMPSEDLWNREQERYGEKNRERQ
jgi:hypothetical protein